MDQSTLIEGPLCWTGADFPNDRSWVKSFTSAMIDEIEAASRHFLNEGIHPKSVRKNAFELPACEAVLKDAYEDLERGHGFTMMSGLPVDEWGLELSRAALCVICSRFGNVVVQNREGEYILDVIDKNKGLSAQMRGYHGNVDLAFHNDGSNIATLLCMETAQKGGETLIVSAAAVYNEILKSRPDLMAPLLRGFHHHRRNQRGPEDPIITPYRAPVFSFIDGVFHSCYSGISILSTREENVAFSDLELEALDHMEAQLNRAELHFHTRLEKGDIQLMNNFTVLHARTGFVDYPDRQRHLLRLWLEDEDSRFNGPNKMDFYVPEASRFLKTIGYQHLDAAE